VLVGFVEEQLLLLLPLLLLRLLLSPLPFPRPLVVDDVDAAAAVDFVIFAYAVVVVGDAVVDDAVVVVERDDCSPLWDVDFVDYVARFDVVVVGDDAAAAAIEHCFAWDDFVAVVVVAVGGGVANWRLHCLVCGDFVIGFVDDWNG
jgi:hypothetical protein